MELTSMTQAYAYLGGLAAVILTFLGVYLKGSSAGKEKAQAKQDAADLKAKEYGDSVKAKVDALVKEAQKEANAQASDVVRDRLKRIGVRKPAAKD